jgi:hypothetical protein
MQGMCWVLLLTIVLLYIFELLAVRLISHGLIFGGEAPPEVATIFPSVPEAIFVLFNVMNGDSEVLIPLFQVMPAFQVVFMFFTVLSSWAILSILTAVVSENMIRSAEEHRAEVQEKDADRKEAMSREHLANLFTQVDTDNDGYLSEAHYMAMLQDKRLIKDLTRSTGISENDLQLMWLHLSRHNESEECDMISLKDFVEGLQNEHRPVSERSIMRLEKRLHDVERALAKSVGHVMKTQEKLMDHSQRSLDLVHSKSRFSFFGSTDFRTQGRSAHSGSEHGASHTHH